MSMARGVERVMRSVSVGDDIVLEFEIETDGVGVCWWSVHFAGRSAFAWGEAGNPNAAMRSAKRAATRWVRELRVALAAALSEKGTEA